MLEIDGVRRALESPITEAGDYISDEYEVALDLSTTPDTESYRRRERLASAIRRLNRNLPTIFVYLGNDELVETYNNVVGQLNEMNGHDEGLGELQAINLNDADELRANSTPFFV